MSCLMISQEGAWSDGRVSTSRYFWRAELYSINNRVAKLKENIKLNQPEARKAYEDFRKERILFVQTTVEVRKR